MLLDPQKLEPRVVARRPVNRVRSRGGERVMSYEAYYWVGDLAFYI